jgi:hypothetical protein
MATSVPGIQIGELMPLTARQMDRIAILRAVATDSNAHSSSGYEMLTGFPHPGGKMTDNLPIGPNDRPGLGGIVRRFAGPAHGLPPAVTLPQRIFNNGYIYWPGQDAGFLGREYDPWMLTCEPADEGFHVQELALPADIRPERVDARRALVERLNQSVAVTGPGAARYDTFSRRAFDLLSSAAARRAFDLTQEPALVRDRYGRHKFGQSCLLARRLIEAGVRLVQVNWPREPSEINSSNPAWDTHQKNSERLKTVLMPPMDRAYSALLDDLAERGLLDETLVVWMGEFGRTPKLNPGGGRDHWGHVFSVALAGGGVRGGQVHGASDRLGGYPRDARVEPPDLTATLLHALGISPSCEIHDALHRPFTLSKGSVLRRLF